MKYLVRATSETDYWAIIEAPNEDAALEAADELASNGGFHAETDFGAGSFDISPNVDVITDEDGELWKLPVDATYEGEEE